MKRTAQNGKGDKRRKEGSDFRESFDKSKLWDNLKKKKEAKDV